MFAVIRTGGKQYRVAKDDKIVVEKLVGEPGAIIELSDVLMIGGDGKAPVVGAPVVDKAAVFAEVVEQSRADKILVFKKKRRKNYRRTRGHRQEQTVLRIVDVSPTGVKPKAAAKAKPKTGDKPEVAKTAPEKAGTKAKTEAKAPAEKTPAAQKPAAKKDAPKADKAAPGTQPAAKKKPAAKAKPKSKE